MNQLFLTLILSLTFLTNPHVTFPFLSNASILKKDSSINLSSAKTVTNSKTLINDNQISVSGTVTDANGNPMPAVNILEKGTQNGVLSDFDGNFNITVSSTQAVLVFSYVGMKSIERVVGDNTTINVQLEEDAQGLDEVVVIGYGTAKKSDLTGAVSSVSAEQVEKVPVTTVDQALQGRAAGVQVTTNDGSPGAGISVKIRGTGTFGDNSPLYVVDGYPISGNLSSLNPSDIQSMEILKDASATAIYGNRASNGVVIITTKRGKKNVFEISFDGLLSVQAKPEMYDVMTAEQFVTAAQQVATTDDYPILPEWNNDPASFRNIDWQNAFYRAGIRQNYNVALRGGGELVQTSFSLGYYKHEGIVKFSNYERYNSSLNVDFTPYSWLKATASVKYTHSNSKLGSGSSITQLGNLTRLIPTMTGNPLTDMIKDADGNYGYYTPGAQATTGMTNLYADVEEIDQDNPRDNFLSTTSVEVTILPGLKAKTNFGINTFSGFSSYFTPSNTREEPNPQAYYSQRNNSSYEWLWENTVSYVQTFGDHSLDIVGGISSQENTYRISGADGNGLVSNELRDISSLTTVAPYGYQQAWSLASQFGRLTYKFLDKYILTGTVRRDGSSRFGPGKKWGVFPSLSAAWKLKQESFLSDVEAINDLKIRASWGKSGNQNIGLFQYLGLYGTGPSPTDNRGYAFGDPKTYYPGLVLNGLANPDLTWEKTTQTDIGIDAAFLNNKITFTADYYVRESSDFLLDVNVPAQTGFSTATRNVGSIRNKGLELSLQYRSAEHEFQWSLGANLTTVNNEILSFTDGLTSIGNFTSLDFRNYGGNVWTTFSQSRVGGEVGAFYGFRSAGIFQTQAEIDALNQATSDQYGNGSFYQVSDTSPGDRKFVDLNGDSRITDDDREIIGSPIPDFFGGINFDGSYKQFDFSLFVYTSIGNDILNYAKRNLQNFDAAAGVGLQNMGSEFYLNHWTPENQTTTYTRLVSYDKNGNNRVSDVYVEDGSFVRLKNIQVGYTFPQAFTDKVYMKKLRVYLSAQNLFTITNYSGLDPEIGDVSGSDGLSSNGVDVGSYPTSKFFTLGVNLGF